MTRNLSEILYLSPSSGGQREGLVRRLISPGADPGIKGGGGGGRGGKKQKGVSIRGRVSGTAGGRRGPEGAGGGRAAMGGAAMDLIMEREWSLISGQWRRPGVCSRGAAQPPPDILNKW